MPEVISIPLRRQYQPPVGDLHAQPNTAEDAETLRLLERERQKLIETVNFLEALRARLARAIHEAPT